MFYLISVVLISVVKAMGENGATCRSEVYCQGRLLHTVQMASIYPDSKTFVDMKMKYEPKKTLEMFDKMMAAAGEKPSDAEILEFVESAFEPAGSEFEPWEPSDWVEAPKFLRLIDDPRLRQWARQLNRLWKLLGRKMTDDVKTNPERYSIVQVPNPVIVPGGRFREFYYWDSYWIVRGLLLSEMFDTVRGMLSNFVSIVDQMGFVPNGGRIYYSTRSQPPLLIPMVKSYLDATQDFDFLIENIDSLEKEFQFWMTNRTVTVTKRGKTYTLARYADESTGPRPESYREDVISARFLESEEDKNEFYSELKSAAESGWDFSSRWFIKDGENRGNLSDVRTKFIVPVDLNAIIYWDAQILSEFFDILNMPQKAALYKRMAKKWQVAVTQVLWHEDVGAWLDFDLLNEKRRDYFYPSNLAPLWTGCYEETRSSRITEKVLRYLDSTKAMEPSGGVPTSREHTGEQWDFPNAWPPLQYMVIVGLDNSEDPWAKRWAYELSAKWIGSNYKAYRESGAMYEKYDATVAGGHGGGGEYEVQLGFGWTNGVVLELLAKYGDVLSADEAWAEAPFVAAGAAPSRRFPLFFACLATLSAGCLSFLLYNRQL